MKINLRLINVGDTVFFRCGGKSKISKVADSERFSQKVYLVMDDCKIGIHYSRTGIAIGEGGMNKENTPFDIIKIEKIAAKTKVKK